MDVNPDSRWIVSGASDSTVRLWRWRWDDLVTLASREGSRNFTIEEWKRYFPDEPYRRTFPELPDPEELLATEPGSR